MSRKTRRHKRSAIQSLEQLILMSASEMDAEMLTAADVQDVADGSMPDVEQLVLENTETSDRLDFQLLEGLPFDAESALPAMLFDGGLADSTGVVTTTGLPAGEEAESQPFSNVVLLETADGEFIEVGHEGLMELASSEEGFDPAAATGVVESGGLPMSEDGTTSVFNDLVLFETPDGDIIEILPEDLIGFLPEDSDFDPAFATGVVENAALPIDGIPLDEPIVLEGPNGELIELSPDEELPEFLNLVPEFNPIAASGAAGNGAGGVAISPDGEFEFEILEVESDAHNGLPTPVMAMTAEGSEAVEILEFVDGQTGLSHELSDFDLASASGVAEGDVSLPGFADVAITSEQSPGGEDGELLEFLNMADSVDDVSVQSQGSDVTSDANSIDLPQNDDTSDDSLIYASAADATGGVAANSIQGTEAGEWISGTVADDVIDAGAGNDEIHVSVGDNVVDGGAGEDTLVVYEGAQADYTITQQADGTTIFEGPGLNGETVRVELTNVEQILFNDGFVHLAVLDNSGGSPATGSTVTGTDAGEWIVGTDQDDDIQAGGGDDEIYASLGINTINGGEGVDTLVVYEGNRADFVLSNIGNGTIYLEGPGLNGKVVRSELTNVEVILFNDGAVLTSSIQDLVG